MKQKLLTLIRATTKKNKLPLRILLSALELGTIFNMARSAVDKILG